MSESNSPTEPKTVLDLSTIETSEVRFVIQELIKNLRGPTGKPSSRERALAVTKLQEAAFWLGESMYGVEGDGWTKQP